MTSAWFNRGLAENDLGLYKAATASLDHAAALDTGAAPVWMAKALTYSRMYLFEEELAAYDKAIERDPHLAAAWHNRGVILQKMNRNEDALISFERAVAIDPGLAAAWFNKAVIHSRNGSYGSALQAFDLVLSHNPRHVLAWFCESLVLINLGMTNRGKKAFIRATRLACNLSLMQRVYGGAIFFSKKSRIYARRLDRKVRSPQDPCIIWYRTATDLYRSQKNNEAVDAFRRVLALNPEKYQKLELSRTGIYPPWQVHARA